ncbi:Fur family transcriptional regulator [Paenibacillus wynnii]|uniref:Fur family transcriptional regulator n=1 Tax=Paenibacillus wynnii TaxID=268407 RepID=UPI00278FB948|nr:transcriptional repressor [Paenibacillus wynnii]MDQ0195406.1 Fur family ferric uptake transcriptional regulator [Paenibacillus wynnii]
MNIVDKVEQISRQMTSKSYRFTKHRETVVRALLEHEFRRPSAEDVFNYLRKLSSKIARATVYRTLELLAEIDIVLKINMDDGVTRFYFRGDEYINHYLLCATCGNVEKIQEDWLSEVKKRLEQEYDFQVIDHLLIFKGIHETGLHTDIERLTWAHCSCTNDDKLRAH